MEIGDTHSSTSYTSGYSDLISIFGIYSLPVSRIYVSIQPSQIVINVYLIGLQRVLCELWWWTGHMYINGTVRKLFGIDDHTHVSNMYVHIVILSIPQHDEHENVDTYYFSTHFLEGYAHHKFPILFMSATYLTI